MERYSLFLDEIHSGGHFDHFCLAGIAINTKLYSSTVIKEIEDIKRKYFDGDVTVILHDAEINSKKSNTPFAVFQKAQKREEFWEDIKNVLLQYDMKGFAVAIHEQDLPNMIPGVRDKYFIALQLIAENFVHYLESVNGFGEMYVESTNPFPHKTDDQLKQHFHYLKANGTLFYDRRTLQNRIGNISFPLKADNVIGLQLADLIPNTLNRKLSGMKIRTYGLMDAFEKIAYDGCCGKIDRFGIKLVP